jgi:hypothetical protein
LKPRKVWRSGWSGSRLQVTAAYIELLQRHLSGLAGPSLRATDVDAGQLAARASRIPRSRACAGRPRPAMDLRFGRHGAPALLRRRRARIRNPHAAAGAADGGAAGDGRVLLHARGPRWPARRAHGPYRAPVGRGRRGHHLYVNKPYFASRDFATLRIDDAFSVQFSTSPAATPAACPGEPARARSPPRPTGRYAPPLAPGDCAGCEFSSVVIRTGRLPRAVNP